jgi:hypothetical protein
VDSQTDTWIRQPPAGRGARHASPRQGWLDISRPRAFLTHLAFSAFAVGTACAVIFFVWYPRPYFQATGAWHVLRVLIGVDLVLGPLLTLIVFKPRKWGLKFDLCVIAALQLAALIYGLTTIYVERPYFTVFAVDRFYVLARKDVAEADLQQYRVAERVGSKPLRGPLPVVAERPTERDALQRLLEETVFEGKPDLERRPEFWRRYAEATSEVIARSRPLSALRANRPEAAEAISELVAALGLPEERLAFLPLIAKNRDLSFIVDAADGTPLDVLDVDPWGTSKSVN